jgi:hypothetical protein
MAQTATQRTTGSTRVRGPMIVTLRGAGSKGHDYKLGGVAAVGTGLDVGLSVQIPTAQTANSFQVEQPDGTVIAAIGASGGLQLGAEHHAHRAGGSARGRQFHPCGQVHR